MSLLVDVGPLRESPAFRRFWVGSTLSGIGTMMTQFAIALQMWTLTHSSFAVGAIGLVVAVPSISFGLFGGAIADAVDRRRLLLFTSCALAVVSSLLALQAFLELRQVWLLYLLVGVQSLFGSVNGPARRTVMPRLLRTDQLSAGAALNLLTFHTSVTLGPALAGLIAGTWGLQACYLADVLSFAGALFGVFGLPPMPPEGVPLRPGPRAVAASLRYIGRTKVLIGSFLADASATVLGMPTALLPALNAAHFGGSPRTLGLLIAAPAIGGLSGASLSGPAARVVRRGLGQLVCVALWGLALALFGLSHVLWLALLFLVLAGAADVIGVVFRTTMVQSTVPDELRGRVNAADYLIGAIGPQVGNFRAGTVASLTTPAVSAVSGGIATVVGAAVIGWAVPAFVRYPRP